MENFAMEQYVTVPTRLENILDLVITNKSELIREIVVEDTCLLDHRLLLVTADLGNVQLRSRGQSISSLNFMSCLTNWDGITRDLNEINWEQRLADQTAQEVYEDLQRLLLETCFKHTSMKRERKRKIVPRNCRIAMGKKRRLLKSLSEMTTPETRRRVSARVVELERQLTESHEAEAINEEVKAVDAISVNTKYFYTFARNKARTKSLIRPFRVEGNIISEPNAMCEILKEQYESVFSKPTNEDLDALLRDLLQSPEPVLMNEMLCTETDLVNCIGELSPTSDA
jgi:hypothetical protein